MTPKFGPLPHFDANAQLQEESVKALHALLRPINDLLLRDERHRDFGVDASLEMVFAGHATNFRAQAQLKAVTQLHPKSDGSFSLPVEVYNLNYLLNGTSPVYILYIASSQSFHFAWVADERRRIEQENPEWQEQQTVSIRFRRSLDQAAIHEIRERVLKEEAFRRKVSDLIGTHALSEDVRLSIDPGSLHTSDSAAAYQRLVNRGLTLVSNGFQEAALRLIDLLPANKKAEPRIQLVAAYAYFNKGHFQKAYAFAGDAAFGREQLSVQDAEVLNIIRDVCECQLGLITRHQYIERQAKRAERPGSLEQVNGRIEHLRFTHLGERDATRRADALAALRAAVTDVLGTPDFAPAIKLQCRIYYAYAEGSDRSMEVTHQIGLLAMRLKLPQQWARPHPKELIGAIETLRQWDRGMQTLVAEAESLGFATLHAEALRTRLTVRISHLSALRFKSKFMKLGPGPSAEEIDEARNEAELAIGLFERAMHLEGQLRVRIQLAEVLEIADEVDGAEQIAREVLPLADALGLALIRSEANAFIERETLLSVLERQMTRTATEDPDLDLAELSDGDVEHFAASALEASRLPAERLPVLVRDFDAMRMMARERLHWCRHLEQIQNLFHTGSSITAYAADPQRFCRCARHRYESLQGKTDSRAVIDGFKQSYCSDCPDRNPKKQM